MGWELFQIFALRLADHFWWLLGIAFMVEPWLDAHIERYHDWAERYVSRQFRARLSWTLSFAFLFIASAWAFSDEYWSHQGDLKALYAAQSDAKVAHQNANDLYGSIHEPDGYLARIDRLNSALKDAQNQPPKIVYVPVAKDGAVATPQRPAEPLVPDRDPDTIYQLSKPVGTVIGAHVLLNEGLVTFEEIDGATDLNANSPFEYRNFVLQAVKIESKIGIKATPDGTQTGVLENVSCKILKR